MSLSICLRAGLAACVLALAARTSPVLSEVKSLDDVGVQQLSAIVTRALETNAEIRATQAAVEAARARLRGAGLPLNNPDLEISTEQKEDREDSKYMIGFSQTMDWHDKRSALEQSARAELGAAEARLSDLRLTKATEILRAVGEITTYSAITGLSKRRTEILDRLERLANQRHAAGDIPQAELGLAGLTLIEAIMQHAENGAELVRARGDFFSLCGYRLENVIRFPDRLPATLPDAVDDEVLAKHPKVQSAHLRAQAAGKQISAIDRQRKPDPTIGVAAGRDDRDNQLEIAFSIPLQFRNDFRSSVDAAQAEALQAEQEAQQAFRNLQARLNGARERYELVANAWSVWISRGRSSLQQRVELLEVQWQAGEMNTTDYLLQVQQTLDTQIAGVRLHGDLWSAWVEWLSASGTLNAWLNETAREQ